MQYLKLDARRFAGRVYRAGTTS